MKDNKEGVESKKAGASRNSPSPGASAPTSSQQSAPPTETGAAQQVFDDGLFPSEGTLF